MNVTIYFIDLKGDSLEKDCDSYCRSYVIHVHDGM